MANERPYDFEVKAFLTERAKVSAAAGVRPGWEVGAVEARAQGARTRIPTTPEPVGKVEDREIAGPESQIPVRIYRPNGTGPFGVLVYYHGGGWVLGNIENSDAEVRRLVNRANCVAVSVEYRLAPESRFPAAAEDSYAALCWVAEHAAEFDGDAARIVVAGYSAGGNLAAVVSQMARDRQGPKIIQQVLQCPVTDFAFDTLSYQENEINLSMGKAGMAWFRESYLRDEADRANPYAAPLQAKDFSNLPPALIVTAEFDPLRDEGEAYGAKLWEAGVPAVVTRYKGVPHSLFGNTDLTFVGNQVCNMVAATLKSAFASARVGVLT